jgi:hypothetical protein
MNDTLRQNGMAVARNGLPGAVPARRRGRTAKAGTHLAAIALALLSAPILTAAAAAGSSTMQTPALTGSPWTASPSPAPRPPSANSAGSFPPQG